MKKILSLFCLSLALTGCVSSKITNLTPGKLERNSTGLYPVEAAWETRDATIRKKTLKPQVIVGLEKYPMRPVPVVKNRWETLVPVPQNEKIIHYRFKFDYEYNAFPAPGHDSKMSPEYKLEIVDKK